MKIEKCSNCHEEREVEDKVIISICPICLTEMKEVTYERRLEN